LSSIERGRQSHSDEGGEDEALLLAVVVALESLTD
jgi:hypothetical protein